MDDKHYLYLSIHDPLLRGCRVAAVALPRVVSPWSHCCVSCRRGRAAARCTAAHAVVLPCVVPPSCLLPIVLWPRCCCWRHRCVEKVGVGVCSLYTEPEVRKKERKLATHRCC